LSTLFSIFIAPLGWWGEVVVYYNVASAILPLQSLFICSILHILYNTHPKLSCLMDISDIVFENIRRVFLNEGTDGAKIEERVLRIIGDLRFGGTDAHSRDFF